MNKLKQGNQTPTKNPDENVDYDKKAKEAEAQLNYRTTVENLNNPPSVRELQEKRLKDAEDERKSANERAKQLEDERLQRIQQESDATAQQAQAERERREKAEADLRAQRDNMILDELHRLQTLQVSPEKKIEEYFVFQDMLAKRFGATKEPEKPKSDAVDAHITFEIEKMKLDFEKWKVEQERANKQMEYDREDKREERKENKELKREELELKKGQQSMIANLPKVFADTLAAGIMARASGAISSEPSSISANPAGANVSHFEAYENEAGELDCPQCHAKVGVGPTTTKTVCAKCQRQFEISRVAAEPQAPPPAKDEEQRKAL